jgi:anthranilate 1,2-dioxygenase reductase subunit
MSYKAAFTFTDGKTLFCPVAEKESVLDAALKNGIRLPFDCREGVCATCKGTCESGKYSQEYVDDDALNEHDLENGKVLTCQTHLHSDATFSFNFESTACAENQGICDGVVSEIQHISPTTAILKIVPESASVPEYLPGQYARLNIPGTNSTRAYSFANWPEGDSLAFLIRILPDGVMSHYIRQRCKPGDRIQIEAPYGTFYLRDIRRPVVMMAGGTGLSAFLAMLDKLALSQCDYPIHLIYGVRSEEDICELERLIGYQSHLPAFSFTIVLSAPGPDWQGKTGYIADNVSLTDVYQEGFDLYVCGPPPMVDAVNLWVTQQPCPEITVYCEKFINSNN